MGQDAEAVPLPPMWPQGDMGRWGGVPGSDCTLLVLAPHRASVCSQQACAPDSELESNHTRDFRETEQLAKPLSDTVADTLLLAAILFASGLGAFSVFAGVNGDVCPPLQRNTVFLGPEHPACGSLFARPPLCSPVTTGLGCLCSVFPAEPQSGTHTDCRPCTLASLSSVHLRLLGVRAWRGRAFLSGAERDHGAGALTPPTFLASASYIS